MIVVSANLLAYPDFSPATEDLVLVRADKHLALERDVNAYGIAQAEGDHPFLTGITVAGAGKGAQFLVSMLFGADENYSLGTFVEPGEASYGLRAFCYTGETPREIARNYQLALARAQDFVVAEAVATRRSWQLAGASAGRVYLGMFLVNTMSPQ